MCLEGPLVSSDVPRQPFPGTGGVCQQMHLRVRTFANRGLALCERRVFR